MPAILNFLAGNEPLKVLNYFTNHFIWFCIFYHGRDEYYLVMIIQTSFEAKAYDIFAYISVL